MTNLFQKILFVLTIILVFTTSVLFFSLVALNKKIDSLSIKISKDYSVDESQVSFNQEQEFSTSNISEVKQELESLIHQSIATLSAEPKTIVKQVPVTSSQKETDHITMGTTASTIKTDWTDIADAQVYIDLANDYSSKATVTWEAFLKVAHGNGKAFARLYDATNNIAVAGSEVSTENNSDFLRAYSGNLALWRGRNLYKVQIKSLNSFEVTISNARIKISY